MYLVVPSCFRATNPRAAVQIGSSCFLLATRLVLDQLERDLKEGTGLSFAYYEILTRLSEAPGRSMRMAALATACVFDRSRLSHAVDRLVREGWVRRAP